MKRFIIALCVILFITVSVIINKAFINDLYYGLDTRLKNIEAKLPVIDIGDISDLENYWQSNTHILSLSVKESDIRAFSVLLEKMKVCKGEEYTSALANARLLAEELHKTESMAFFDLF